MSPLDGFREGGFDNAADVTPLPEVEFRHAPAEGAQVTVVLTGKVVGRGLSFISILIDGQEKSAEKLLFVERENRKVVIQ